MRPRGRWERTPADLARSVERERSRFLSNIMIDPRPWAIAKAVAPHVEDQGGEGLRGVFEDNAGADGRLIWWNRDHGSHHQARLMLGLGPTADVLEVEINVAPNGTLYACWQHGRDAMAERFLDHPTMRGMIDGCLASNGRQIRVRGGRVRLLDAPASDDDVAPSPAEARLPGWQALETLAMRWAASRRTHLPDGTRVPPMSSVTPFRAYVRGETTWRTGHPVPLVTVEEDGAIVATWRATASIATIRFADGAARTRMNLDGRVEETGPHAWRKPGDVRILDFEMAIHGFRSAEEKPGG